MCKAASRWKYIKMNIVCTICGAQGKNSGFWDTSEKQTKLANVDERK